MRRASGWLLAATWLWASPALAASGAGGGLLRKPISEWGFVDWGIASLAVALIYSAVRKAMNRKN